MTTNRQFGRGVVRRLGTIGMVLFVTAAALVIALAVVVRTDASGVSRVGDRPVLTVLSDSMTPTFRAGDLLIESSSDPTSLSAGDVITFRVGGSDLVTHRIVERQADATGVRYVTRGDANNAVDSQPVAAEQVVGVYATHVPYGGYVLRAAGSRQAVLLLVLVPLLLLVAPAFAALWRRAGESTPDTTAPDVVTADLPSHEVQPLNAAEEVRV